MTPPELEASLEQFFRKRVRLVGGYTIKLEPTEAGIPDRLVIFPGGHIRLVELKAEGGSLSPIQVAWHAKVGELGVPVHTLTGRGEVMTWIRTTVDSLGPSGKRNARRPRT